MPIAPLLLASLASPAPPQKDLLAETRRITPTVELIATRAAPAADFDGDGDVDVVSADVLYAGLAPLHLFENLGAGTFAEVAGAFPAVDVSPVDAVAGDLDGDGDADLLVINTDSKPAVVLLNSGGAFTYAADVPDAVGAKFLAGALGDLDMDGDLDLYLTRYENTDQQNRVFDNDGSGLAFHWDVPALPPLEDVSRDVALGDVDADGDLDAYVSNEAGAVFPSVQDYVARNIGPAKFKLSAMFAHSSRTAALADFDGDGNLDAYAASIGGDVIAWNPGGGGAWPSTPAPFADPSTTALAADLGGDGIPDVLVTPGPRIARGLGGGAFADTSAADVPGGPGSLFVSTSLKTYPTAVALVDLDGDQDLDLYWPDGQPYAGFESVLWLNDAGAFGKFVGVPTFVDAGGSANAAAAGDLDGDGNADLLTPTHLYTSPTPSYDHLVAFWRGDGTGAFESAAPAIPAAAGTAEAYDVDLGDLDGDGDLDAFFDRYSDDKVFLNDGAGGLTALSGATPAPHYGSASALGDLDGDGDLDVLATELIGNLLLLRNAGGATFTDELVFAGNPFQPIAATILDADGDGDLDVLWPQSPVTGTLLGAVLLANDGGGVFTDVTAGHLPVLGSTAAAAGDVDGDGDTDAVLVVTGGADQVLVNDGTGVFAAGLAAVTPGIGAATLLLDDVDSDGALDLIDSRERCRLYLGDGSGGFGTEHVVSPLGLRSPKLADVDGDGDRDLIATTGGRPIVLTNLGGGQVARRSVPRAGKPLRMEVFGEPGAPWALAASPGTASIALGAFGTLQLDPSVLWAIGAGTLPASGPAVVVVPVANDPTLVGVTVHWQALTGAPFVLSSREAVTVTAY